MFRISQIYWEKTYYMLTAKKELVRIEFVEFVRPGDHWYTHITRNGKTTLVIISRQLTRSYPSDNVGIIALG